MDASPGLGLLHFLGEIPDPRSRHGRQHPLSAVLALACCAILCGARGYAAIAQWAHDHDIELMHRLGFTRRPPQSGGIRKVRWRRAGSGKSGGVRVIYFTRTVAEEIVLLTLYAKSTTDNLTGAKFKEIRRALES